MKRIMRPENLRRVHNPRTRLGAGAAALALFASAACGTPKDPSPDETPTTPKWSVSCESLAASMIDSQTYHFNASLRAIGARVTSVEFSFGDGRVDSVTPEADMTPPNLMVSVDHPYPKLTKEYIYDAWVSSMHVQLPSEKIISVRGNQGCRQVITVPRVS